jgi:hypothetical protein
LAFFVIIEDKKNASLLKLLYKFGIRFANALGIVHGVASYEQRHSHTMIVLGAMFADCT